MKKIGISNTLIEYLFILLFIISIVSVIIIYVDSNRTSNNIERINESIEKSPSLVINSKNILRKESSDTLKKNNKYFFIVEIDSALFETHNSSIKKSLDEIKKLDNYILDSDERSSFLQIISLILFGLVGYLSKKWFDSMKKSDDQIEELKFFIRNLRISNELIRECEKMIFYSNFLVTDNKPYKKKNILYCDKIDLCNEHIKSIVHKKELSQITNTEKSSLVDLLHTILRRFEELKLNTIDGYYSHIYSHIQDSLDDISRLKLIEE